MSQKFKRNKDIIIVSMLSVAVGLSAYFMFDKKVEITITIIAGGFSLAFGLRQSQMENDRIFKELFIAFNERYDLRFNDTLNKIAYEHSQDSPYNLSEEEKKLVIDYLNLCAEEYLWYTKGRIDENVWAAWEIGMKYFISLKPISDVALAEQSVKGSYYGLFDRLSLNNLSDQ